MPCASFRRASGLNLGYGHPNWYGHVKLNGGCDNVNFERSVFRVSHRPQRTVTPGRRTGTGYVTKNSHAGSKDWNRVRYKEQSRGVEGLEQGTLQRTVTRGRRTGTGYVTKNSHTGTKDWNRVRYKEQSRWDEGLEQGTLQRLARSCEQTYLQVKV